MGRERIPTALVRRWLLRGALVGGAVGATLVLGAPVQAAETTPAGPVTGLLGGLTTVADDASGSVLELAAGTVDHVVPAVQDAPLVRDVAVVADLPVTDAVRGVTDRTTGVVRELTTTVDQVLAPVVRPVDTVVIEVVPPPVVDAVPATDEDIADPDEGAAAAAAPAGPISRPSARCPCPRNMVLLQRIAHPSPARRCRPPRPPGTAPRGRRDPRSPRGRGPSTTRRPAPARCPAPAASPGRTWWPGRLVSPGSPLAPVACVRSPPTTRSPRPALPSHPSAPTEDVVAGSEPATA